MTALMVTVTVGHDRPDGKVKARNTFRNIEGVRRLQRLAERFGLTPTYLLTYPILNDPFCSDLIAWAVAGKCELGTCLQPWTTPPFEASEDRLSAYPPSRIPPSAVQRKLTALTERFVERAGFAPKAHRAEMYGLCSATLQSLEALGYRVDSSVTPGINGREFGSVDWRRSPPSPYHPDRQRPSSRGSSPVLQVPITVNFGRSLPSSLRQRLIDAPRIFSQLGGYRALGHYWLDPTKSSAEGMRRLADVEVARGAAHLNLALRSDALHERCSAGARTAADVARTFEALDTFFRYGIDRLRVTPTGLNAFACQFVEPGLIDGIA